MQLALYFHFLDFLPLAFAAAFDTAALFTAGGLGFALPPPLLLVVPSLLV